MKTQRVGIVGTGWGKLQVESLRRVRGVQVAAICDTDAARLEQTARQYNIPETFANYGEMLAGDHVDWVCIAAPPELHQPMVASALQAGKHVLCEKPIALSTKDARALLEIAEAKGIVHAVDFEMRYLPAHAYAKELIDEDYVGPVHRVDVTMTMERPWGEHGTWAAELTQGGGVLTELGSHFIDTLLWWFGDVSAVLAGTRTHFPTIRIPGKKESGNGSSVRKIVTGDDAFWCVLQFKRGGEALVNFVTGARYDPGWTIGAYGQTGSLIVKSGQLLGMRDGDREIGILPIPKRLEIRTQPSDPLMWAMARLMERQLAKINAVPDSPPVPGFGDAVAVSQVIDAIRRSSDERRWVSVE